MSKCQLTTQILESECIGDSLARINNNFYTLDRKLCDVPTLVPGNGVSVSFSLPHEKSEVILQNTNSYQYLTQLDYKFDILEKNLTLDDGTTIKVNEVNYDGVAVNQKPLGTFTVTAPNNNPPKVTLFWTGAGNNDTTVYSLNSATIGYNGSVTTLSKNGDLIYVGGDFSTANSVANNKVALLSSYNLNFPESLLTNPVSSEDGDLQGEGAVYKIIPTKIGSSNEEFEGLVVAGSFQSLLKGRGLTVINLQNNTHIPLYVHGNVYSAIVIGDASTSIGKRLYIVGDFDYLCIGNQDVEDLRIYTKGIAKIDLQDLSAPGSIDENFAESTLSLFDGNPVFYTIGENTIDQETSLFLGGNFRVVEDGVVTAQNLIALDEFGEKYSYWNPIVSGPVHTIKLDKDNDTSGLYTNLYVGGKFDVYGDANNEFISRHNAIAFKVSKYNPVLTTLPIELSEQWTPNFNDAVTFIDVDTNAVGYVYCYGNFTNVNHRDVTYLVAIEKDLSTNPNAGDLIETWRPRIQCAPEKVNSSIIVDTDTETVIIGGNFYKINSATRNKLARITSALYSSVPSVTAVKVNWEVGAQPIGGGMPLAFSSSTPSVTAFSYVETNKYVTTTSFPPITAENKGFRQGQPYRFYIKRPGKTNTNDDTLKSPVNLLGWSIDFN